jgi:hypothetical protein
MRARSTCIEGTNFTHKSLNDIPTEKRVWIYDDDLGVRVQELILGVLGSGFWVWLR